MLASRWSHSIGTNLIPVAGVRAGDAVPRGVRVEEDGSKIALQGIRWVGGGL